MLTPLTLDGRSLSQTTRVADLRGTDLVPLVRPSEPLPADQNVAIRADRLQALLGTGSVTPGPSITLYDTLGIHTDGAATQRLVNEVADAAVRVPNLRPAGHAVTADFTSTPGWGTGSSSLSDLPVDTLFIGTTAITIFSVAGRFRTYVLADDPQGTLSVWRDGRMSGTRVQARWVLSDAPQAVATAYTSIDGTTYVWTLRQFASAYVGTPLTIQFFQARTAAVHPAPTEGGDPVDWEAISPQNVVPATLSAWQYIGNPLKNNISLGPLAASNTFAGTLEGNAFGAGVANNSFGTALYGNDFGLYFYQNTIGINHVYNTWGVDCDSNIVGARVEYCSFGDVTQYFTIGDDCQNLTVGSTCILVSVGANCKRVQIYNCQGTPGAPFIIPAGTTDAVYRNNLLVTAQAFTAITANQYGTHPAFSSQTALNAYLLGGTGTAPPPAPTMSNFTATPQ